MLFATLFVTLLPALLSTVAHKMDYAPEFELIDILGLKERTKLTAPLNLQNSASKFLLHVYEEFMAHTDAAAHLARQRRDLYANNFITQLDRREIENCNNIITFAGRATTQRQATQSAKHSSINFNTNDVPTDFVLVHATLRLYQQPTFAAASRNATISICPQAHSYCPLNANVSAINTTSAYRGWLEFNVTQLLNQWLQRRTLQQLIHGNDLLLTLDGAATNAISAADWGLVLPGFTYAGVDRQPFIIGYFNGPELLSKVQRLRFKRDVNQRKRKAAAQLPRLPAVYKQPKTCERLNFTLDFKELHMHNWVIAPKKFEAYFCGGECNFPLGAKMNATNHAIVQTLMHLKQPNLPKPCCVPTKLGSISILHYLNEDSVNLSKYPQSVAKECGCH